MRLCYIDPHSCLYIWKTISSTNNNCKIDPIPYIRSSWSSDVQLKQVQRISREFGAFSSLVFVTVKKCMQRVGESKQRGNEYKKAKYSKEMFIGFHNKFIILSLVNQSIISHFERVLFDSLQSKYKIIKKVRGIFVGNKYTIVLLYKWNITINTNSPKITNKLFSGDLVL